MSRHILQEIEATVDRIMIIDRGKIVADGSTKSLLKSYAGKIKLKLNVLGASENSINKLKEQLDLKILKIKSNKSGHFIDIEYSQRKDPREKIFNFAVKNKWAIIEMSSERANLETIFRKLTN